MKKQNPDLSSNDPYSDSQLFKACEFEHPYPCTKILWSPDTSGSSSSRDLLATTGDYLRLWSITDDGSGTGLLNARRELLMNNVSTIPYGFVTNNFLFFL